MFFQSEPTPKSSQACDKWHQLVINSDGGNPECICREGMTVSFSNSISQLRK